jgi:hypothetical protein
VVPVRWVRRRLREVARRGGGVARVRVPIENIYLLRWPLVRYAHVVEEVSLSPHDEYPILVWE